MNQPSKRIKFAYLYKSSNGYLPSSYLPVGPIFKNHGFDDSQLYLSFKPADNVAHTEALCRVERCLNDIVAWMRDNMRKLNKDKTEFIFFASQRNASLLQTSQ